MTNRVPTKAQKMYELKSELFTRQQFLEALLKEAYALNVKEVNGQATDADQKRAKEIVLLASEHVKFINKNKEKVRKFFYPATV